MLDWLWRRLAAWLQAAGSVWGVLGLALALAVFYRSRRPGRSSGNGSSSTGQQQLSSQQHQHQQQQQQQQQERRQRAQQVQRGSRAAAAPAAAAAAAAASPPSSSAAPAPAAPSKPAGGTMQAKLAGLGVRRVTLSLPGVLLHEASPAALQESATVLAAAVPLARELLRAADVYMLVHVEDDVGQAAVTGAMEAAGLVGHLPSQLPPQRLLFCSTQAGKQAIVRQIEPDLHVDNDDLTVDGLRRFVPQLLLVQEGLRECGAGCAPSLVAFFGAA